MIIHATDAVRTMSVMLGHEKLAQWAESAIDGSEQRNSLLHALTTYAEHCSGCQPVVEGCPWHEGDERYCEFGLSHLIGLLREP